MRRFIERYTSNPIRGLGRIARGNVRQGLRDMAPAAKVAAAFIPGGALASAGLGAAAGALEQGRGASAKDFARGAAGGAATGMAGKAFVQNAPGISSMFTGGGGAPPVPGGGGFMDSLRGAGSSLMGSAGGIGRNIKENLPVYSQLATGAMGAYGDSEERKIREQERLDLETERERRELEQARRYKLDRDQFEFDQSMALRAQELSEADRGRRQQVAKMLAPMFQEALRRQTNRPNR